PDGPVLAPAHAVDRGVPRGTARGGRRAVGRRPGARAGGTLTRPRPSRATRSGRSPRPPASPGWRRGWTISVAVPADAAHDDPYVATWAASVEVFPTSLPNAHTRPLRWRDALRPRPDPTADDQRRDGNAAAPGAAAGPAARTRRGRAVPAARSRPVPSRSVPAGPRRAGVRRAVRARTGGNRRTGR